MGHYRGPHTTVSIESLTSRPHLLSAGTPPGRTGANQAPTPNLATCRNGRNRRQRVARDERRIQTLAPGGRRRPNAAAIPALQNPSPAAGSRGSEACRTRRRWRPPSRRGSAAATSSAAAPSATSTKGTDDALLFLPPNFPSRLLLHRADFRADARRAVAALD